MMDLKDSRYKEDSRRVKDLKWRREDRKVRGRDQEIGFFKILWISKFISLEKRWVKEC